MSRTYRRSAYSRGGIGASLRRPSVQFLILVIVGIIIYLVAISGGTSASRSRQVSVDEAYQAYQQGAFILDVRTPEEWNKYHAPNTTLIPFDQLQARLGEIPRDKDIVIVCSSATCSGQARDLL